MTDPYIVLGVKPDASDEEIKTTPWPIWPRRR